MPLQTKKVVIITGGTSGIGKALAETYVEKGYAVVISGRNAQNLSETVLDLQKKTPDVLGVQMDVSKEEDCERLIQATIQQFGRIDLLINNAGISMRALFKDLDLKVLKQVMDINFWGTVYCTKFALPYLLQQKGSIVGISSVAGFKGLPARTGYSSSKFAMHGFLESVRIENFDAGLHVLIACPGFTASNIRNTALAKDGNIQGESPLDEGKIMQADEVAHIIARAVDKRKRDVVMTKQGKSVFWMNKFFPSFVDKQVLKHFKKEPNSPLK